MNSLEGKPEKLHLGSDLVDNFVFWDAHELPSMKTQRVAFGLCLLENFLLYIPLQGNAWGKLEESC